MKKYIEISKDEAIQLYCNGTDIFICDNQRQFWCLPKSYEYSSNEPAEKLFLEAYLLKKTQGFIKL